jgi:hypothetical protein
MGFEKWALAVEGRSLLGWMPLMMMLPGRSDDKMLENDADLPPHVMALRSQLFMSARGFNGLLNINACAEFVNKTSNKQTKRHEANF